MEDPQGSFQIQVKGLTKSITLKIHSWDSVSVIKTKFQVKVGIASSVLNFTYDGKQLKNERLAHSYGL